MNTDLNLLFGVLAVQLQFLTPDQFAESCQLWAGRGGSLADLLVERGLLDADDRAAIDAALARRLARHGGDSRATLTAHVDPGIRATLGSLADPNVGSLLDSLPRPPAAAAAPETTGPRYANHRHHADGGVGKVFVAADTLLRRDIAYKVLHDRHAADTDVRRGFWTEAQVTAQLEHPNIVPLYDGGHDPATGDPYYVMRFLGQRTLADAIRDAHDGRGDGPLDGRVLRRLVGVFATACNAIAYAHSRGVIHRDMKPANVILGEYGEVIVLDWGLAMLVDQPGDAVPVRVQHTLFAPPGEGAGPIQGTPSYMAPEQAVGAYEKIGRATDVYNLGATLFDLLTGSPPFEAANPMVTCALVAIGPAPRASDRVRGTPKALDAICAKAMGREPTDRYADAAELAKAVQAWLDEEPVEGYRAVVAELAQMMRANPDQPDLRKQYARMCVNLGLILAGAGRASDACDAFTDAVTAFESLLKTHPTRGRVLELATCRNHLIRAYLDMDRMDLAKYERRAIDLLVRDDLLVRQIRDAMTSLDPRMIDFDEQDLPLDEASDDDLYLDESSRSDTSASDSSIDMVIVPDDLSPNDSFVLSIEDSVDVPTDAGSPVRVESGAGSESDGFEDELDFPRIPNYRIQHQLARGGMGRVYLGVDLRNGRECAIKVWRRASYLNSDQVYARYRRETTITAALRHPSLLPLFEAGQTNELTCYAVTPFVAGQTFDHVIRIQGPGPATWSVVLPAFRQVARALDYAHSRGVIHRDPKPSNMMLDEWGNGILLDFGLARAGVMPDDPAEHATVFQGIENSLLTQDGAILGTPAFLPPEMAQGQVAGRLADVFILGASLYFVLTGKAPFYSESAMDSLRLALDCRFPRPSQINPKVPHSLEEICLRAMAPNPTDRYRSAAAFADDHVAWSRVEEAIAAATRTEKTSAAAPKARSLFGRLLAFFRR